MRPWIICRSIGDSARTLDTSKARRATTGDVAVPEVNAVLFLEDQEKFFHSYIKHLHSVVASTGMLPPPFIEAMDKNFHTLIGVWNSESAVMLSQWKEEKA